MPRSSTGGPRRPREWSWLIAHDADEPLPGRDVVVVPRMQFWLFACCPLDCRNPFGRHTRRNLLATQLFVHEITSVPAIFRATESFASTHLMRLNRARSTATMV